MSGAPALRIRGLTVAYRERLVLDGLDADVEAGAVTGLIGPNGAGKSTLINAALGLVPRLHGTVECFGDDPRRVRERIGYLPQRSGIDWDYPATVRDVAAMGRNAALGWFGRRRERDRALVERALEITGTAELADRPIGELSGGQQQRTLLARALAQDADLIVLDEPFQGVDAASERAMISVLRQLRDEGRSLLLVVHDLSSVPALCDRLVLLGGGRAVSGTVAEVFTDSALERAYGDTRLVGA